MARLRLDRRRLLAVGTAALAVAVAVAVILVVRGGSASSESKVQTTAARRGNLTETVDASVTFQFSSTSTLSAPSSGTNGASPSSGGGAQTGGGGGVVTQVQIAAGQQLNGIAQLFALNDSEVFGIPSAAPFYRNLVSGDQGDDVHALQQALTAAGYPTFDTDGTFGSGTLNALERFQVDNGLDETGSLSLTQFVSYPPGSTVVDLKASVGQSVPNGGVVADLGVGSLVGNALVSQSDFPNVKLGQQATLDVDSAPGTQVPGAVLGLGAQAATQSQSAGSSSPVQLGVTVAPTAPLPADTRAGMTGQAHIDIVNRQNVVIVPTSAVRGTGNSPTVQVMKNGKQETRPVVVGLTTGSDTEIVTGVQPGEIVVTGTNAPAQTATTTSGVGGGQRGGGGGGGFIGGGEGGGGAGGGGQGR
jgi:macrolide-specific efflux system membrane fusion protein